MKRILWIAISLAPIIYALRRLNRLVADVETQRAQIEALQTQSEALRARLEAQRAVLERLEAQQRKSHQAILDGAAERIARWHEPPADLDSPN